MKKLSKEKQQQLLLTFLVTVLALSGVWFGLIRSQKSSLQNVARKTETAKQKLGLMKHAIQTADQTEQQLCEVRKQLDKDEEFMASGDLYAWVITSLRTFKLGYKVDIPQFSQIDGPKPVTLLPEFPYKQLSLTIGGTATFYELGRFIADFENQFPHIRLVNLTLEPSNQSGGEPERLSFKVEIAALVKPTSS